MTLVYPIERNYFGFFICSRTSMDACNLGTLNVKISNFSLCQRGNGFSQLCGLRIWKGQRPRQYAGLVMSEQSKKVISMCRGSLLETSSTTNFENGPKETEEACLTSQLFPNLSEVQTLLADICDTTSVAEFELKLEGFQLHVMRTMTAEVSTLPPCIPAPFSETVIAEPPDVNRSASSPSLALCKRVPSSRDIQTLVDNAADEGLVIVLSPRVGIFRRCRTIKGKRAPPSCKEKQIVEGQVLCFIEQLGGELPIESDASGEVVKILREDGDPVGYNDALIAILPGFPGIKKLAIEKFD